MYLVFDIGATFVKYGLMTDKGEITTKGKIPTINGADGLTREFIDSLGGVYDKYKDDVSIEGIAVGMPGQINVDDGIAYNGGGIKFIKDMPIERLLSERCDHIRVSIENDGKCAALAEIWQGNAKDCNNACVLVFGTGIGGGIIIDRKVYHGSSMKAGEISYCFDKINRNDIKNIGDIAAMSLEESYDRLPYIWGTQNAIRPLCYRVAGAKGISPDEVSGELIYSWIDKGDKEIIEIMEDTYFDIAKYCCILYTILDPDVILIGGGISAEPRFIEGINRYAEKLAKLSVVFDKMKIDVCSFRNDSNLLGALYNFKLKYEN